MSTETVIRAQGLAKKYILGQAHAAGGLRHAIEDAVRFKWLRRASTSGGGEFWALRDVTFDVRRGDVVGIIGRNGAGKSTLLKLLSRITEPTQGRIGIKGRVASLLEVGTGFHPELTGRENIFLNGAILGMTRPEIRKKFDEIAHFAEVEKFLDTPVKRYSSGMYVRLAFAVAAHLEPEILVVDEVLAVGDAEFQRKCLGKMREVSSNEGRTVLFVSHAMHSVRALCDTGILLNEGRIEALGPIEEVVAAYAQRQVAPGAVLASNRGLGISLVSAGLESMKDGRALRVEAIFQLDRELPHCGLGLHVLTEGGFELCYLRPETTGLHFGDRSGKLEVAVEIGEMSARLGAGTYTLALSLHETNWRCVLERVSIGEFVVPSVDVFGTGYPPKFEKDGALVLPVSLLRAS